MKPDLDQIEALAPEREALWSRLEKATFLTEDEKRSTAGYGPKPGGKFNPYHDDAGRFDFSPDGEGDDGGDNLLIPVAYRPRPPQPPKPPTPPPAPAKPAAPPPSTPPTSSAPAPVPIGKKLRNEGLAGQNHPATGIPFDKQGFPDFSGIAEKTVRVPHTGDYGADFAAADRAAGITSRPPDKTWHHHQDGHTMQLVPRDVHGQTGHTGSIGIGNLPGRK